jgi:hypothetical protein
MKANNASLGSHVAERFVRVVIAIVGLLILRGILSVMPMLRTNPVWAPTFQPNEISSLIGQYPTYGDLIRAIVDGRQPGPPPGIDPNQYAEVQKAMANFLMNAHLAIFPITIAKAVIDTLIFGLLFLFGRSIAFLFRTGYSKFPDLGQMINFCILTVIVGIAYQSYQGLAFPLLFPENGEIYGWVFLALVLAPLLGLAVVVARNMDSITGMVMHSGATHIAAPAAVSVRCSGCGHAVPLGTKFCPECGATMNAPAAVASADGKWCSSCGAGNPPSAKFCKGCGGSLAA